MTTTLEKQDTTTNSNKSVLKVHSSAIHITNEVSLVQRKAWFYMLYKAYHQLPDEDTFSIPVSELMEKIACNTRNIQYVKQFLTDLMRHVVEWNILGKDGNEWSASSLLAFCSVKDGVITYQYSPFLRKKLYSPEMFVKINLLMQNLFCSKYSLAIYTLCLDYLDVKKNYGSKILTVEELRKFLGLKDGEYKLFGDVHRRILKKSEEEINANSDMKLTITPVKEKGKKVSAVKFTMHIKKKHLEFYLPSNIVNEKKASDIPEALDNHPLFDELVEIGVTQVVAHQLLQNHSPEEIQQQIKFLPFRKAKNLPAVLIKSIKESWSAPNQMKEELEKQELEVKVQEEKQTISDIYEQAKNSSYIITKKGKRFSIHSVTSSAIEVVYPGETSKSMIRMVDAVDCLFE